MTDIVTHTYLKPIGMRFLSGQGILELKETQGKQQVGNGDCLPLSCACIVRKNISLQTKRSILTIITNPLTHIGGKIMPFI